MNSLYVTGTSIFNNTVNMKNALIGPDIYHYSDSILEVNKNIAVRNNVTTGSRIDLQVGTATTRSYLSMEEGYDINISTPIGIGNVRTIRLASDQIVLDSPSVFVPGKIFNSSGLSIGAKSPIVFTTKRNVTINGSVFSVYDINLISYVQYIILDGFNHGYNIRQFRMRTVSRPGGTPGWLLNFRPGSAGHRHRHGCRLPLIPSFKLPGPHGLLSAPSPVCMFYKTGSLCCYCQARLDTECGSQRAVHSPAGLDSPG